MLTLQEGASVTPRVPYNWPSGTYENIEKYLIPVESEERGNPVQTSEHPGTNIQSSVANPAPATLPHEHSLPNQSASSQPGSNLHDSNKPKSEAAKSHFSESSHGKPPAAVKRRLSNFRNRLRSIIPPSKVQDNDEINHLAPQPAKENFFKKKVREIRPKASAWLMRARLTSIRSRQPDFGLVPLKARWPAPDTQAGKGIDN